jgi:hypothetical protein
MADFIYTVSREHRSSPRSGFELTPDREDAALDLESPWSRRALFGEETHGTVRSIPRHSRRST